MISEKRKKLVQSELIRKLLHISGILCVPLSSYSVSLTLFLLYSALIIYLILELLRLRGKSPRLTCSMLTLVSRGREYEGIVLGPVTLVMGIVSVLVLFPIFPAKLGIIALTVGDGTASLIGRLWGNIRPKIFFGKSLEGSLACFLSTFIVFLYVGISFPAACIFALITACIEVLPLGNFDNILIPLTVSFCSFTSGVVPYIQDYLIG